MMIQKVYVKENPCSRCNTKNKEYSSRIGTVCIDCREREVREGNDFYIYAAKCEGFVKVGMSRNLKVRVEGIKRTCPFDVYLICSQMVGSKREAKALESKMHKALKKHEHRNEWFHDNEALRSELVKYFGQGALGE